MVEDRLVVEVKSVEQLSRAWQTAATYLRLTNQPVGLLINFGGATLKEGIRRVVNDSHNPSASPRLRVNQNDGVKRHVRPHWHDRVGDRRLGRDRLGDRDGAGGAGRAARGFRVQRREARSLSRRARRRPCRAALRSFRRRRRRRAGAAGGRGARAARHPGQQCRRHPRQSRHADEGRGMVRRDPRSIWRPPSASPARR